jgi:hypothetical protein
MSKLIQGFTPVYLSQFTRVDHGAIAYTEVMGHIYSSQPAGTYLTGGSMLLKAAPATPYCFTVGIETLAPAWYNSVNWCGA